MSLAQRGDELRAGPEGNAAVDRRAREIAPIYVSSHPNAGLPNPLLPTGFPETPSRWRRRLRDWADNGWLNIVGGCCGTTPEHIRAIADAVRGLLRQAPEVEPYSATERSRSADGAPESNFVNIGERTNVTGSPAFAN